MSTPSSTSFMSALSRSSTLSHATAPTEQVHDKTKPPSSSKLVRNNSVNSSSSHLLAGSSNESVLQNSQELVLEQRRGSNMTLNDQSMAKTLDISSTQATASSSNSTQSLTQESEDSTSNQYTKPRVIVSGMEDTSTTKNNANEKSTNYKA